MRDAWARRRLTDQEAHDLYLLSLHFGISAEEAQEIRPEWEIANLLTQLKTRHGLGH